MSRAEARLKKARETLWAAESERDRLLGESEFLQSLLAKEDRGDALQASIAASEARVDELLKMMPRHTPEASGGGDAAFAAAVADVTKAMFLDLQADILGEVGEALRRLSVEFGVRNIESMSLSGGGHLKVRQGGADLSFTKLTAGEKVRVRVAAALAAIEVAERRGFGRHPGLLVLDSPGAQEMSREDFSALIGSVAQVAQQSPHVQVIVGAVWRPELEERVPVERRRQARGFEELF